MFGSMFGSRAYAYEIYVMVDGRWRLDKRLEGDAGMTKNANEQMERSAIAQANALLNIGDFSAVKIIRSRERPDGQATQSEIFNKTASARPKAMATRAFKGVYPVCSTLYELAYRPSAKAFSAVFREFLDKQNATAIELLHSPQHQRKLNDMSNFMRAGMYAWPGHRPSRACPDKVSAAKSLRPCSTSWSSAPATPWPKKACRHLKTTTSTSCMNGLQPAISAMTKNASCFFPGHQGYSEHGQLRRPSRHCPSRHD